MEIGLVAESLITRDFELLDEAGEVRDVLTVTWDRNLFTGDYDRRQAKCYGDRVREIDKRLRAQFPLADTGHGGRRKNKPRKPPTSRGKKKADGALTPSAEVVPVEEMTSKDVVQTVEQDNTLIRAADAFENQKETDAILNDLAREIIADSIALDHCINSNCRKTDHSRCGVIKAWSMTSEGRPVEPFYDNLVGLPLPFLSELQDFMKGESLPKGVRMLRVRTTSDSTDDSSPSVTDTPMPESPIM